jgi:hypothetical protein
MNAHMKTKITRIQTGGASLATDRRNILPVAAASVRYTTDISTILWTRSYDEFKGIRFRSAMSVPLAFLPDRERL